MSIAFVHLSDIHFGQEKGGQFYINTDAKEQLINDVRSTVAALPNRRASGLLVTGDVAYGGKKSEYTDAAKWLDRVTAAAGCNITDVQVVPGNHDIDWDAITPVTEFMLNAVHSRGEEALDEFLADDDERALLYRRFRHFLPFADAYRCPLDVAGTLTADRVVALADGRSLRFVRVNSALLCAKRDVAGTLLLGARQRVLPVTSGEEIIVLSHHPIHWLKDGDDARRFIRARARVFISGHEHSPSVLPETVEPGCDVLMLAAGATVPPHTDEVFTYTYNILEFDWEESHDGINVTIHPRAWNDNAKRFEADDHRLGCPSPSFTLGCPNFRSAPRPQAGSDHAQQPPTTPADTVVIPVPRATERAMPPLAPDSYTLLILHFFRDISAAQRRDILIALGALPEGWTETLTQAHERLALDSLIKRDLAADVTVRIQALLNDTCREE